MTLRLLLAGFAAGTLAVQCCAILPPWMPVALVALALAATALLKQRRTGAQAQVSALACVAAMCLGVALAALRAEMRLADFLPHRLEGVNLQLRGIVDTLPAANDEGVRFAFRVESASAAPTVPVSDNDAAAARVQVPGLVALAWYRRGPTEPLPAIHTGERWQLVVRLKRPHGTLNFAGFDLEAWLFQRNLRATGVVRDDPANERLAAFAGNPFDAIGRVREALRSRIQHALEGKPYAGVVTALAIGDQAAIPQEQWRVFNRTGISHLISISGLHITVFATLVGGACYRLCRRSSWLVSRIPARRVGALVGLVAAALYTVLSGAEIPALRTLVMLAVATLGLWLARPGTASTVWLWALVTVLLVDPWASVAPGFWLSFGAVGLLLYAGSGRLAPRPGGGWWARWRDNLAEASHAQWVVTLGLAPGTLALFQQLSLVAPLANAVAIPVVTFAVVPLALASIVLPIDALLVGAHAVLEPLMRMLLALSDWPLAAWQQHAPPAWCVLASMVGVLWLLAPVGVPARLLGCVWLLPLFLVVPAMPPQGRFDMVALDVGQGLSVLVRTATHQLLFDTGPRYNETTDAGVRIIVPALRAAGTSALDMLVVSHADSDHSGGALSVLDALPVRLLLSSLEIDNRVVAAMPPAQAIRCLRGQAWAWDGVQFSILHPRTAEYADPDARTNDRSCVLRIEGAGMTALLTGDIEARDERALLADAMPLAADVLVVPHHGSRTSSTTAFVAAVAPRIAVFTAGYRNRFAHPRPDVMARYSALDAELFRSDVDGAIALEAAANALAVTTARVARKRYWHDTLDGE